MPDFLAQLRFRLLELGCPPGRLPRLVREVADHREDLVQAALAEGFPAPEAEVRADELLGNPQALAEGLMVSLRRTTWCGRHQFIAFALLPLLTFPVLWALILCLNLALGVTVGFGCNHDQLRAAADDPVTFRYLALAVDAEGFVAIAVVALFFCWQAGRSAAGQSWMLVAGSICTLHSLFVYSSLSPHHFAMHLESQPHWLQAAVPLLILGLAHWLQRRRINRALKLAAA